LRCLTLLLLLQSQYEGCRPLLIHSPAADTSTSLSLFQTRQTSLPVNRTQKRHLRQVLQTLESNVFYKMYMTDCLNDLTIACCFKRRHDLEESSSIFWVLEADKRMFLSNRTSVVPLTCSGLESRIRHLRKLELRETAREISSSRFRAK
jgi:hypothetical protein